MDTFIQMNKLTKIYRQLNSWINKVFIQISFSHLESEFLSNHQLLIICHYLEIISLCFFPFFSISVFIYGHWWPTGKEKKGEKHLLFHSTTSTRFRTFRHSFGTFHVRWLPHTFNRIACVYHTATRCDLPLYWITVRSTNWWCHINFCLFTWCFDSRFLLQQFDTGNQWTRTHIELVAIRLYYKQTD